MFIEWLLLVHHLRVGPTLTLNGGWRFIALVGSKLGRTSSLHAAAYGSVTWILAEV